MADDSLQSTIAALTDKLAKAAEGLLTVKVRTLLGNAALAKIASEANGVEVLDGTQGAYTACNMATGDIVVCFSDNVTSVDQIKQLHDEAVKLGTETFRFNVDLLTKTLLQLIDKQRSGPG
ncbi:hypothetical protein ACQW02_01780 [Humitalea sp. 24SJ18S-53]|uniref:hypothetical protein n=1 Tax=Humitalea sp. 24SJ18S-53 TaxID=3422307 RepID=UPI003D666167